MDLSAFIRRSGPLADKIVAMRAERIARGLIIGEDETPVAKVIKYPPAFEADEPKKRRGRPPKVERPEWKPTKANPIKKLAVVAQVSAVEPEEKTDLLTVKRIMAVTASSFGLSLADLTSRTHALDRTMPRMVAMYLARKLTKFSLPQIGARFDRDHTTVLHGFRKIERLYSSDLAIRETIDAIEQRIKMSFKIPLQSQAMAISTLLAVVTRGEKLKPSELDYLKPQVEAGIDTLRWCERNAEAIKETRKGLQESAE